NRMLCDEAYLGYPTFSKRRGGRFHRFDGEGGIVELEPELKGKDKDNDPADIIKSAKSCYEPLIERAVWDAVQRKLHARKADWAARPPRAPRCAELYLRGLVTCSGCGTAMTCRADRMEYYCASYDRCSTKGNPEACKCLRNGVKQSVLEGYVERYLEEIGK